MYKVIHPYSVTSIYLDLYFNDTKLWSWTGCIIKSWTEFFLITNYHVLSGRDFITQEPIDHNCAIPNKVKIHCMIENDPCKYNIINEDIWNNFFWWPDMNMDLVILKINDCSYDISTHNILNYIDQRWIDDQPIIYPWQTICIVWFPYWVTQFAKLPIWKTWAIASEYNVPFQGRDQCFLIDAATRWGMSWSPVFAYFSSVYSTHKWENKLTIGLSQYKFLWIYSGRWKFPKEAMNLEWISKSDAKEINEIWSDIWMVWKTECIDILLTKYYN